MPRRTYRRRYRPRRKTTMRRSARAGRNRSMITLPFQRNHHFFKRTCTYGSWYPVSGPLTLTFKLSDLPGYTDFQNLYDEYKIYGVKVRLIPHYNQLDAAPAIAAGYDGMTNIVTVIDQNDDTPLATFNEALEFQTSKIHQYTTSLKRYFVPGVQLWPAGVTGFTQTAGVTRQWLTMPDVNSGFTPDVKHYSFKAIYDSNSGTVSEQYQVYTTFYFACRTVK